MVDRACRNIRQAYAMTAQEINAAKDNPFGGFHIVMVGDFNQHQPVQDLPLYYGADENNITRTMAIEQQHGRDVWKMMNAAVILTQQHRFDVTVEGGRKLLQLVTMVMNREGPALTREQVQELCEILNSRAVTTREMAQHLKCSPRVIVLRHAVRYLVVLALIQHHAFVAKQRLYVWRCTDVAQGDRTSGAAKKRGARIPLSQQVLEAIEKNHITHKGGDGKVMQAIQFFYVGCEYCFLDNAHPSIGWVNNNTCTAHSIVLDPREPEDDLARPVRYLRYMPLAINVVPDGPPLGQIAGADFPTNTIPVTPTHTSAFTITLPEYMPLYKDSHNEGTSVSVIRRGIPLDTSIAVTDFYAQGLSVGNKLHFVDVRPPATGHGLNRGNILVPISRGVVFEELHLLAPLYNENDDITKQWVIDKYLNALKPDTHLLAEMRRLHTLEKRTYQQFYDKVMSNTSATSSACVTPSAPLLPKRSALDTLSHSLPTKTTPMNKTTPTLNTPPSTRCQVPAPNPTLASNMASAFGRHACEWLDTPADGNCGVYAAAQAVRFIEGVPNALWVTEQSMKDTRLWIGRFILTPEFAPFLEFNYEGQLSEAIAASLRVRRDYPIDTATYQTLSTRLSLDYKEGRSSKKLTMKNSVQHAHPEQRPHIARERRRVLDQRSGPPSACRPSQPSHCSVGLDIPSGHEGVPSNP